MKQKHLFILLAVFILVAATLACGLFSGSDETTDLPAPTEPAAQSVSPEEPEEQQPPEGAPSEEQPSSDAPEEPAESPPLPDPDLDDEYRSEEGGYAFQPITGYEVEEFFGLATMVAPDADPDLGPMIMLIGGHDEQEATSDEIFDDFMKDAESEDVKILERKEITVDGKSGLLAEIAGDVDGKQVVGRIVVVAVTPTQQFTMFASAPSDRWGEIGSSFDAVLASVHFFEPQEPDLSGELENVEPDAGSADEPSIPDISSLEDFPTEAGQLPPGSFAYLLAGSEGFPTIVAQGTIQDQSTSAEFVIGLVSEDQRNTLTLFIPLNVAPGVLAMNTYDANSPTKGPGAAVYMGLTLYTNTDGIIMVDAVEEDTITGSAHFTAVDQDGNQIAVTGFFNEIPLAPR